MAGLTESSRRRADEDERASLALRLDEPAEERARGEKRGGQVERDRPLEAREVELPGGDIFGRVDACDGGAHLDRAEGLARVCEEPVHLGLVGQVGPGERRAAELVGQRAGALRAAVMVHEHARALGGERARARRADAARCAGHDDALAGEPGLHARSLRLPAQ